MSESEIYTNRRGETVVPFQIFKQLNFEAVMKSAKKPYPPKRNIASRRPRKSRKLRSR